MLEYTSEYKVLVCPLHKCAVADADRHLRFDHAITGKEKDALIQQWVHLETIPPAQQHRPSNGNAAREWLARPVDGFACQACPFLTIKWDYLAVHGKKAHGWSLPFRPEATKYPLQYATRVKIQTLFPYPHIRWFTVDEKAEQAAVENASVNCSASPHLARPISPSKTLDEMLAEYQTNLLKQRESEAEYQRTVLKQREGEARRLEVQRATAPKIRAANSQSFFLARIPLELRLQIYLLAIGEGAVFHIADINGPIKPALADARGTDEHDKENGRQDNDHMEVRTEWEYNMDEDLAMDNVGDTTCKMRAIALPDASRNCVAFLETCTQLYQEAPEFSTASRFLDALSPDNRRRIPAFGIVGLQPCLLEGKGRYGCYHRDFDFARKTECYYQSEKAFLEVTLPQLSSLKELSLGFDLSHIAYGFQGTTEQDRNLFSPQAFWLNKFLRLPILSHIKVQFTSDDWKDSFQIGGSASWLIDQLNHVDGQKRICAKFDWEDEYPPYILLKPGDFEFEQESGPMFPLHGFWA